MDTTIHNTGYCSLLFVDQMRVKLSILCVVSKHSGRKTQLSFSLHCCASRLAKKANGKLYLFQGAHPMGSPFPFIS